MFRTETAGRLLSIIAGYVPSGIAYGILATAVHIPWFLTLLLSLVVYSGAVQSAFVGFWSLGFEPFSMVITAFLLNLRHTFYGPHLQEHYTEIAVRDIFTIGPFLTDEVYALGVSSPKMPLMSLKRLSFFSYGCWIIGTAIGIASTGGMPQFIIPILYLALPALFLGLMIPKVKGVETAAAAIISLVAAALMKIYDLPSYFILLSILLGVLAGTGILKYGGGGQR